MDDNWNVIFSYTRAQAISDGVLIDVTAQAREMGFKVPAAITDNLFHTYIEPPAGLEGEGQSVEGRLHAHRTSSRAKSVTGRALLDDECYRKQRGSRAGGQPLISQGERRPNPVNPG